MIEAMLKRCVLPNAFYVLSVRHLIKLNTPTLSQFTILLHLIGGAGGSGGGAIRLQAEMNVIISGQVSVNGGNGGNTVR